MAKQLLYRITNQGSGASVHKTWSGDNAKVTGLANVDGVGTAGTGSTATERGDSHLHYTLLDLAVTMPAIVGGTNLGIGLALYTFPSDSAVIVPYSSMNVLPDEVDGNITADTPDVGIGTVIASGAVTVLSGTATFENVITGQTATDCNGTAITADLAPTAGSPLRIAASGQLFLNMADGWAASGEAALPVTGQVAFCWYRAA